MNIGKYLNKYMSSIALILLIIIFILLIILFNTIDAEPAQVELKDLYNILAPGKYKGTGTFSKTEDHPYGLSTELELYIEEHPHFNDALTFECKVLCTDKKTGELVYNANREGKFFYKPKHGNELFFIAKTTIDKHVVSSQYGHVIKATNDSLVLDINCAWHIHHKNFKNSRKIFTRNGDKLYHDIHHNNMFGISDLSINEEYTHE